MDFAALLGQIDMLLLIGLRVMGLFTTAPVWSNRLVPMQIRVFLSVLIALVVLPLFDPPSPQPTLVDLVPMALRELLVGMVIGFVASLALAAVQFAGQLLDLNMGLSMVNLLDPMTNTQAPVMGNFLYILAFLIFFSINGHHLLLSSLVDSYAIVPLGTAVVTGPLASHMVNLGANLFALGLQIAAPVLAALFLTTVALGLLNRAVPQMNVFIVGMPLQLSVGIFMVMIVLPLFVTVLQGVFRGLFTDVYEAIRLLVG